MIILTTGATRIGSRLLRPADGPFEADPEVEARLVRAGVAQYCNMEPVITVPVVTEDDEAGIDPEEYAPVIEGDGEDESGEYPSPYTEDELMLKTNKELETIITAELGMDLPKKANKATLVKLIMDYYSIDGEAPPALDAEVPEV
jgi:hypothetical protein